jgi:signal peptidase I
MQKTVRDLVGVLVLTLMLFLLLNLVVGSYSVVSESMQPEFRIGDRLLVNLMAYSISDPARGDIILFKSEDGYPDQIKRVIGLPGDIIEIKNNVLYVNDVQLLEPYVSNTVIETQEPYPVPSQTYFVLEDNRNGSNDSSAGLTVPRDNIKGRAWITAWPPDRWGGVDSFAQAAPMGIDEVP